ncbi:MAG TPA: hypothetical protein VMU52_04720 [Steroidobacteraceae bacterium]|nr:hypothetical protein [Steroidobacteraceae bacterium]
MRHSGDRRARSRLLGAALGVLLAGGTAGAQIPGSGGTPEQRAIAAILQDSSPRIPGEEHPLPLAASWNGGRMPLGFSPDWQVEQIRDGRYLLPWFELEMPPADPVREGYSTVGDALYFRSAIRYLARNHLPLSFVTTTWERLLPRVSAAYPTDAQGNPLPLSPFGPIAPWYQVGRAWAQDPSLRMLQAIYPDPPLVLFVSDNESPKVTPDNAKVAPGTDGSPQAITRRRAIGNDWIARYRSMIQGFRDGLQAPGWRAHSVFIGYDAFVTPAMGRWQDWAGDSLHVPGRTEPWPYAWEGASVSYYVHNWAPDSDSIVWSPQIEAMNDVPVLSEVRRTEPDFWFELSTWDGQEPDQPTDKLLYYAAHGQKLTPARYGGMVQFGMWLLRPRVVREFRNWTDQRLRFEPYFDRITDAVARIHRDPVLRNFWRRGRLVANPAGGHPYETALPPELASRPRWFLLDSPANPPRPWQLTTPLAVYPLALVRGRAPHREWLVYAFSPLQRSMDVPVRIPGGPRVIVRAARGGAFTRIREGTPLPVAREVVGN